MRPTGKLEKLQAQFVRVRIVDMTGVDVGLFDFDFDLTFQMFVLNKDEQIYLRYGGRDDRSADSYLSVAGLETALANGLDMHGRWKAGQLKLPPRPPRKLASTYREVARVEKKGECVHCHHIAAGVADQMRKLKGFDRLRDIWRFPDPRSLGIELDPDHGVAVSRAANAAAGAGMKSGDIIQAVGSREVHTFTDLQHALDALPVDAKTIEMTVQASHGNAATPRRLTIEPPEHWRVTNVNRRAIGNRIEPFPGFWSGPVPAAERRRLGLDADGFASRVGKFWTRQPSQPAGLKKGDIVFAVNGVKSDPLARNAMIHIRLRYRKGDKVTLGVLRNRKKMELSYRLNARPW